MDTLCTLIILGCVCVLGGEYSAFFLRAESLSFQKTSCQNEQGKPSKKALSCVKIFQGAGIVSRV